MLAIMVKKILGFYKDENNVSTYNFLAKYFYQFFQIFSNEKINSEKSRTLFYNRLFYKALSMINHFFYFASSFKVQFLLFCIRMTQKMSKGGIGYSK